jgi:hypothetical protein
MNSQSNPDINDLPEEDVKDRSTSAPDVVSRDDERRSGRDNGAADEEPGPFDDDGLPENVRRRVPS